jgi:hypothetical protein
MAIIEVIFLILPPVFKGVGFDGPTQQFKLVGQMKTVRPTNQTDVAQQSPQYCGEEQKKRNKRMWRNWQTHQT